MRKNLAVLAILALLALNNSAHCRSHRHRDRQNRQKNNTGCIAPPITVPIPMNVPPIFPSTLPPIPTMVAPDHLPYDFHLRHPDHSDRGQMARKRR